MNYTERVDGIQIRDVTYLPDFKPTHAPIEYDIVKWKQLEHPIMAMRTDGQLEWKTDYCYSLARLVWDEREEEFKFIGVGMRFVEACPSKEACTMISKFAERKAAHIRERGYYGIKTEKEN